MTQDQTGRRAGQGKKAGALVKTVLLFALLLLYMAPFFLVVINAFKSNGAILKSPLALVDPKGVTLDNFTKAFERMDFLRSFANSLLVTVVSVALIVLISSMTAWFFVRYDWKFNKLFFGAMIAAMIVPFQVIMIPLVSIYGGTLHMLGNPYTLIAMNVGFGVSMAVFIYHGFIRSGIPLSLEEAATLDGCSPLQAFFRVVFPLMKPTTATIVVLDVLWVWNDYLLPSLVLSNNKSAYTLPLSTYSFYGAYTVDYGAIMAALCLTALPVILLYVFLQRQIISGVISGAVKA